jgi:signal transduction histidine kinase
MSQPDPARGYVLLLDDDPGIRLLEANTLRRAGFEVSAAGDYAEARVLLAARRPDLLLLDYQLASGENGLEFYRQLVAAGSRIPAVMVTGFGDETRVLEAMRAGVRDFVPKTPNFVELVAPTVERVLAQVEQERRLREAEAASKAKDDFLAALSHELRTPLTPVLALVSALRKDERLAPDVRADMALIHRNIMLEARLIDDLLDLTKIARGKLELRLENFDLCPVLAHALHTCRDADTGGRNLLWEPALCPGPIPLLGDSARLTQVFWNILKNAAKFTPEGGKISVQAELEESAGAKWVRVAIADSGVGIEPAALPRIFDAFEQGGRGVTRQFGGLGLGLAISRAIVDLHQGTITAASAGVGRGATFTVRLPCHQAALEPPPAGGSSEGQPVRNTADSSHILLVEDHSDTALIMARMLRRAGFQVTQAISVADALAKVAAVQGELDASGRAHPVQLVVSDLGLPDGSGVDLMRQLRARHHLTGIALSGFGMEEDVRRSHEAGFTAHLTKPIDFNRLLGAIREQLAALG